MALIVVAAAEPAGAQRPPQQSPAAPAVPEFDLSEIDFYRVGIMSAFALGGITLYNHLMTYPWIVDGLAVVARRLGLVAFALMGSRGSGFVYDLIKDGPEVALGLTPPAR